MERLTEWNESSETAVCERPAAYEDIKAPFTENTMINLAAQALGVEPSRLRELAEADKISIRTPAWGVTGHSGMTGRTNTTGTQRGRTRLWT